MLIDPAYSHATWFSMGLGCHNQLSAAYCVIIYSSSIFEMIGMNAKVGSALVGFFSLLGVLISTQLNKFFGYRSLYLCGNLVMACCHLFVAICLLYEWHTVMLALIMIFLACYNATTGPYLFPYVA